MSSGMSNITHFTDENEDLKSVSNENTFSPYYNNTPFLPKKQEDWKNFSKIFPKYFCNCLFLGIDLFRIRDSQVFGAEPSMYS